MKLTAVLLTFCLLQVAARSSAQVNYSAKQGDLKAAFATLKQQTGMVFFYSPEDIAKAIPVTVQIKNLSIEKALDMLLKDQPVNTRQTDPLAPEQCDPLRKPFQKSLIGA